MSHPTPDYDPHNEGYGTSPKTLRAYIIGLVLSFLLTAAAFLAVSKHLFSTSTLYITI